MGSPGRATAATQLPPRGVAAVSFVQVEVSGELSTSPELAADRTSRELRVVDVDVEAARASFSAASSDSDSVTGVSSASGTAVRHCETPCFVGSCRVTWPGQSVSSSPSWMCAAVGSAIFFADRVAEPVLAEPGLELAFAVRVARTRYAYMLCGPARPNPLAPCQIAARRTIPGEVDR